MTARGLVLLLGLLALAAHAQTRYVSDKLGVELRRGPSTEYLILRNLEAGTALEVLEQDAGAGYSRVRLAADRGVEGWILTRFLTTEPIARERLAVAERSLTSAQAKVGDLERKVTDLSAELATTRTDLDQTRTTHGAVSKELEEIRTAAANVVEIRDQNQSMRQRLAQREDEVRKLTLENETLRSRDKQNWFLVGGGVLLAGVVIGLVAPSLRRRRRSDW
ncbi:MAG TPA: TIGR04211 family SH3 domain-containing protein [Gammaproteobacteria bacterium]|nr:TIGR04211 family SH3 domain-containing protein [Gammaproteobacteria bacterium]